MTGPDEATAGSGPGVVAGGDDAELRALVLQGTSGAGHVIRRLFQLRTRIWQDLMPCDLTGPQFTVLGTLYRHGAMDQGTLGQHAALDKSTAAPIVERLRGRGLLTIRRDASDARRKLLELTPQGRQIVVEATPFAVQVDERLLAALTEGEREGFFRLAHRVLGVEAERPQ
jgi:DNA-binding MarR family transcriptional regulator